MDLLSDSKSIQATAFFRLAGVDCEVDDPNAGSPLGAPAHRGLGGTFPEAVHGFELLAGFHARRQEPRHVERDNWMPLAMVGTNMHQYTLSK